MLPAGARRPSLCATSKMSLRLDHPSGLRAFLCPLSPLPSPRVLPGSSFTLISWSAMPPHCPHSPAASRFQNSPFFFLLLRTHPSSSFSSLQSDLQAATADISHSIVRPTAFFKSVAGQIDVGASRRGLIQKPSRRLGFRVYDLCGCLPGICAASLRPSMRGGSDPAAVKASFGSSAGARMRMGEASRWCVWGAL